MIETFRIFMRRLFGAFHHYFVYPIKKRKRDNRRLSPNAQSILETEAAMVVNLLGKDRNLSEYLEIGIERGFTLEAVKIQSRTGVDPFPMFNVGKARKHMEIYQNTSDDYFSKMGNSNKFDFIYLDGLHTYEQTRRDFENSLKLISSDGFIMVDDTVPSDEFSANPNQSECYRMRTAAGLVNDGSWHGDVYKLVTIFASTPHIGLNWVTLSDLDNPKTIFWMSEGIPWIRNITENSSASEYLEIFTVSKYETVGIPERFNPVPVAEFLKRISPR